MADSPTTEPRGCPTPWACSALAEIERLRAALLSISVQNSVKLIWKIAREAINDA